MAITWREYQDFTISTAMYKGAGSGSADEMEYCGLGMGEESLEIAGPLESFGTAQFDSMKVFDECGDGTYYIAREYAALGVYPKDDIVEASASPGFPIEHYLAYANAASKAVGMVKKAMRKDGHAGVEMLRTDPERRAKFLDALGRMLSALARLVASLEGTLSMVLEMNRSKLLNRRATGTLHERPAIPGGTQ
jgi:hypothetical protein